MWANQTAADVLPVTAGVARDSVRGVSGKEELLRNGAADSGGTAGRRRTGLESERVPFFDPRYDVRKSVEDSHLGIYDRYRGVDWYREVCFDPVFLFLLYSKHWAPSPSETVLWRAERSKVK